MNRYTIIKVWYWKNYSISSVIISLLTKRLLFTCCKTSLPNLPIPSSRAENFLLNSLVHSDKCNVYFTWLSEPQIKLLAQKIRHDNTGSQKFFFFILRKKSLLIFSYNVIIQWDKLDHIFPCPNGKATHLGCLDGLSSRPCSHTYRYRYN